MNRGIWQVSTVMGVVSLVARTAEGEIAMQLNVATRHFDPWQVEALTVMLNRLDPPDDPDRVVRP